MLNKKVSDINFEDVKAFCASSVPENEWLDYKRSFSPGTANDVIGKLFSAIANAHGGWVLFGIKEERDAQGRGTPGEFVGLNASEDAVSSLKSIGLNSIYPPVLPEFAVCHLPTDASKVIVVARIFESDSTPHKTQNGKVYLRTNDIAHLQHDGKEASVEELEFLLNRRQKSLALKDKLLTRTDERCFLNNDILRLSVSCLPAYPSRPLVDVRHLIEIAGSSVYWEIFHLAKNWRTAHEGLVSKFERATAQYDLMPVATEFNVYGLVYYNTFIKSPEDKSMPPSFDAYTCLTVLWCVLMAAETFYRNAEFGGLVDITMRLRMKSVNSGVLRIGNTRYEAPIDKDFAVNQRSLVHQLIEQSVIDELFRDFLWAAGMGAEALTTPLKPSLDSISIKHKNAKIGIPKPVPVRN